MQDYWGLYLLHSSSHFFTPPHHAGDVISWVVPDAQTAVAAMTVIHSIRVLKNTTVLFQSRTNMRQLLFTQKRPRRGRTNVQQVYDQSRTLCRLATGQAHNASRLTCPASSDWIRRLTWQWCSHLFQTALSSHGLHCTSQPDKRMAHLPPLFVYLYSTLGGLGSFVAWRNS